MKQLRVFFLLPVALMAGLAQLTAAEPTPSGDPAPPPKRIALTEAGFRFPGGDPEAGKEAFVKLNCVQCHAVANVELGDLKAARRLEVTLAGKLGFVKKYEDIITAITNPKHVISQQYRDILSKEEAQGAIEPLMPDLTKDMSVRQLMDIVAFLNEAYGKALPEYNGVNPRRLTLPGGAAK